MSLNRSLAADASVDDPNNYSHHYAPINGINMHFVTAGALRDDKVTAVVLCHGWPDLWYGWRKQINVIANSGFRVIVPDMRGFGATEAPLESQSYSLKILCTDLLHLLNHLKIEKAIFIGHDHGGSLVWRMCLHYPEKVISVGSLCTAYTPPFREFLSVEKIAEQVPTFMYQVYLNDGDKAQKEFEANPEKFFKAFFMGTKKNNDNKLSTPTTSSTQLTSESIAMVNGKPSTFLTNGGPLLSLLPDNLPVPLFLSQKFKPSCSCSSCSCSSCTCSSVPGCAFDYYVSQYKKHGFRGGLNWYRTHKVNYEDEKRFLNSVNIPHKALIITAGKDRVLTREMSLKMDKFIPNLERGHVPEANHWLHQEYPDQVNQILISWLKKIANSTQAKL